MQKFTDKNYNGLPEPKRFKVLALKFGILGFLFFVLFYFVPFHTSEYWMRAIIMPTLILGLAGLGLNLLFGYAGQASLGTAAFMAVGAFAAYNLMYRVDWLPLPIAYIVAGVISGLTGLIFGLPSLRIKGFYLIASTLTAQFFAIWFFTNFGWFYNYNPALTISAPSWDIFGFDFSGPRGRYWIVVSTTALLTLFSIYIVNSQTGRNWKAIRDLDTAASVVGVPILRTKLSVFFVSSFICGIAGILWGFAYLGAIDATGFSLDKSFQLLFIIIIGGLGSISGSYIGSAIIVLTPILLNILTKNTGLDQLLDQAFLSNMQKVLFGVLIIFLLIRQPEGVLSIIKSWWQKVVTDNNPKRERNERRSVK
tara:strand:+ start:555 stop:1652 length:1098 start_codon:yes stop_codon:yes gene_type:complete